MSVKALCLVVVVLAGGWVAPFAQQRQECLPIDRVMINGKVFTGNWVITRRQGSSVAEIHMDLSGTAWSIPK